MVSGQMMNWSRRPFGFLESRRYSAPGWWIAGRKRLFPQVIDQGLDHLPFYLIRRLQVSAVIRCLSSLGRHKKPSLRGHRLHDSGVYRR